MKKLFTAVCLLTVALVAQAKLNVVATTGDFGAIARAIGGDNVVVTVLARPTEDPHFVDAKPSLIVKLNRADAVIEGGAELELGWLPPLIEARATQSSKLANRGTSWATKASIFSKCRRRSTVPAVTFTPPEILIT